MKKKNIRALCNVACKIRPMHSMKSKKILSCLHRTQISTVVVRKKNFITHIITFLFTWNGAQKVESVTWLYGLERKTH